MLSFRRKPASGGELHVAELTGPNGERFALTVHKYPRERKWTAVLVGPNHRVLARRRFFASTPVEAARLAVDTVVRELEFYASAAAALLPQLEPVRKPEHDGGVAP